MIARKFFLLLSLCAGMHAFVASTEPAESAQQVALSVSAVSHAPLNMLVVGVGNEPELHELAIYMSKDLAFSGQFAVDTLMVERVRTRKMITDFAQQGYTLIIFLTSSSNAFEWRLYDAMTGQMIQGKKYRKRGALVRGWAHEIADAIWPELTGTKSSFASKIAYCKDVTEPGKKRQTHVIIADYDGSNQQTIVATPTLHVAPRWNADLNNPLLFYSESTSSNIRLMCITMQGKRRITSNFDGINMLPTFSGDGTKAVYCASKGHGNCQLYLFEKGVFRRLTHNDGNNVSPSLSHDGKTVFYCSDAPTGKPQIYRYDLATKVCKQITKRGFNFCPQYHANGKLAYSSLVAGQVQIFVYDQATDTHTQITSDEGSKDECFWSPCGSYLIFSVEKGASSRLALFNVHTRQQKYITGIDEQCSYPCWSPLYTEFPVLDEHPVCKS